MRKVLIIASREYQAAVRTKSFLVSVVVLPLLMGGSILAQMFLKDMRDTRERTFVVIDHSPGGKVGEFLQSAAARPPALQDEITVVLEQPRPGEHGRFDEQRFELSERVRSGEIFGFLEVGTDVYHDDDGPPGDSRAVRYQTNSPTYDVFPNWAQYEINEAVRQWRFRQIIKQTASAVDVDRALRPVPLLAKGLNRRDEKTGAIQEAPDSNRVASLLIPALLVVLMFMMVLVGATPLMQGVVEEKMQRIAEVLLGSVRPFELMLGKLVGMTAVSLTLAAVYLSSAYWAAAHYGYAGSVPLPLLAWFIVFQTMATMMFGALFIAIGAACTDMRETQNLLWPVMLLAVFPTFLLAHVLREPNSPFATAMSFFPFATPTMMIARQAVPPGVPWWQPTVGVLAVLATTILCVYVAGRIFRVGLLMQGKGAKFGDLVKWVFRG